MGVYPLRKILHDGFGRGGVVGHPTHVGDFIGVDVVNKLVVPFANVNEVGPQVVIVENTSCLVD